MSILNIAQLVDLGIYDENEKVVIMAYTDDERFAKLIFFGRTLNIPNEYLDLTINDVTALSERDKTKYGIHTKDGVTAIFVAEDLVEIPIRENCKNKRFKGTTNKSKRFKESSFGDTKYFALMSYTPGNAETGIYGDECDIVDVVAANNEYEAANKFEKKLGSKINRRTDFVSEISKDDYYQILADLDTMTESFDNADYLDNNNCLGYAIQLRNMNTGYIDLLCYNTKYLAEQNLTIAELMDNETNYDTDVYEDDFNTIYGTADNIIEEIDFRRDLENGKIYGEENALVYGNDEGFYVVMNKIPVDLYF